MKIQFIQPSAQSGPTASKMFLREKLALWKRIYLDFFANVLGFFFVFLNRFSSVLTSSLQTSESIVSCGGDGTCNEFLRKCAQVQSWLGVGRALLVGRWTRAVFSLYIGVFWNCAMLQMVVSVPHALLPAQAAAIECTVTGPNVFIDKNFHDLSFLTNLTFSNLHCDASWCCSLQSYLNKRLIIFSLI